MTRAILLLVVGNLAAQQLVVDRGIPPGAAPAPLKIERTPDGFLGDSFRLGAAGEVWFIDAIRVWAMPNACFTEITLKGALDNPPVPGQPLCDCHAMMPLGKIAATRVKVTGNLRQLDFTDLKWSVPGATDIVFSVLATRSTKPACTSAAWTLSTSRATDAYRLHRFTKLGVPEGLLENHPKVEPRWINLQVRGHKIQ